MKDPSSVSLNYTFWDFNNTWGINPSENDGYPYLVAFTETESVVVPAPVGNAKRVAENVQVTFTCSNKNADIYYTPYDRNLKLSDNCVSSGDVKVFGSNYKVLYLQAYYEGVWSERVEVVFPKPDPVPPPSFAVKGIFGGRDVTFNCTNSNARIYYTTENRSALKTTDPNVLPGKTVTFNAYYGTVYARAYYNGEWSNPARLILKIPTVNTPTITRLNSTKVKIKTTTPSSIVYYTLDGTTPSASNYDGKFWSSHDVKIPAGKTVKAIAVRNCFSDSGVATAKV